MSINLLKFQDTHSFAHLSINTDMQSDFERIMVMPLTHTFRYFCIFHQNLWQVSYIPSLHLFAPKAVLIHTDSYLHPINNAWKYLSNDLEGFISYS